MLEHTNVSPEAASWPALQGEPPVRPRGSGQQLGPGLHWSGMACGFLRVCENKRAVRVTKEGFEHRVSLFLKLKAKINVELQQSRGSARLRCPPPRPWGSTTLTGFSLWGRRLALGGPYLAHHYIITTSKWSVFIYKKYFAPNVEQL